GIQILIENHGGISNNGRWLADLLDSLAGHNVKAVADFDNWCLRRANGQLWGAPCRERYNRYQGMMELMPYAAGVSVKAFNFDAQGKESDMDYDVLFDIIHASGYTGPLGIEYEGDDLPAREGILRTLDLARRSWERKPIVTTVKRQQIDETLQGFVDSGQIAGASALIFEKGNEVYFNTFGYADLAAKLPLERNTIMQIFSMTKPITGVALMQLYEKGMFQLDDPVGMHLPELAELKVYVGAENGKVKTINPNRPMTIRDLTRHTGGFYNGADIPALKKLQEQAGTRGVDHTLSELAVKMAQVPLQFHPGAQWEYGPSVDIQALLVERLSGQPFGAYLREHVLDPLGMSQTRYHVPAEDQERMSAMYVREPDGALNQLSTDEGQAFNLTEQILTPGGWGLTATLDDYQRFARMLVNGGALDSVRILSSETIRLMATNHLADEVTERIWLPSKGEVGFGIDFAVRLRPPSKPEENRGSVGEFFWDGAASTLFWVDPANELTAVLFVQLRPYDQIGLHRAFRKAVYE
ncbi:MAG: serine hydrolase domain-containing protein, partial [Bacteroidota bacterium]